MTKESTQTKSQEATKLKKLTKVNAVCNFMSRVSIRSRETGEKGLMRRWRKALFGLTTSRIDNLSFLMRMIPI
ncbi:MAG: hypothetical protein WCF23_07665 [Candidatus Nitrosopolaris sp.]